MSSNTPLFSGYELSGRSLRVDTATSDKSEELKSLGPTGKVVPEVSPYGAPCPPDNAPEAISQAVASLPPEQMFELMKQMKVIQQLLLKLKKLQSDPIHCLIIYWEFHNHALWLTNDSLYIINYNSHTRLLRTVSRVTLIRLRSCCFRTLSWPTLCYKRW